MNYTFPAGDPDADVSDIGAYVCSGDIVGRFQEPAHVACTFRTYDANLAMAHFEQTSHAVDLVNGARVPYCTPATHVWRTLTRDIDICKECWETRTRPSRNVKRPVACPEHDPAYCNQCAEEAYR